MQPAYRENVHNARARKRLLSFARKQALVAENHRPILARGNRIRRHSERQRRERRVHIRRQARIKSEARPRWLELFDAATLRKDFIMHEFSRKVRVEIPRPRIYPPARKIPLPVRRRKHPVKTHAFRGGQTQRLGKSALAVRNREPNRQPDKQRKPPAQDDFGSPVKRAVFPLRNVANPRRQVRFGRGEVGIRIFGHAPKKIHNRQAADPDQK